jgi:hypothetical protein
MTTETTTMYRVTTRRPSRSKVPNAWIATADSFDSPDDTTWVHDGDTVPAGTVLVCGGNVRRATRTEKVRERWVVEADETWDAWGGTGTITTAAIES